MPVQYGAAHRAIQHPAFETARVSGEACDLRKTAPIPTGRPFDHESRAGERVNDDLQRGFHRCDVGSGSAKIVTVEPAVTRSPAAGQV